MSHDQAYILAEEKIEEALNSGATELNLRGIGLTDLPESIRNLIQLDSLDLSSNRLLVLPESLKQLSQLRSLTLSENRLSILPEWVGNYKHLQVLHVSHNMLAALPESLEQLTHLKILAINKNKIALLPNCISKLRSLQRLFISSNDLVILPDWIVNLAQLISINSYSNKLTTLPESIGKLAQLEMLSLQNNELTDIPDSLGNLSQLRSLQLQGNKLTTIPKSITKLTKLQSLNLSKNHLASLPESLGTARSIQNLNLANNMLTYLPDSLCDLLELQNLDLSDNSLSTLPERINLLSQLRSLLLANNQLRALPDSFGYLTKLLHLNLDNNSLIDLPSSIIQIFDVVYQTAHSNPLNPELNAAYKEGRNAVMAYLREKTAAQIKLDEAKLIIIGEGEVGKTCLMDALLGNPWEEHLSTHGIQIQQIKVVDSETQKEITLNSWDFGGQPVYRPTHQLFFSVPAVYLVVWKPREGPQQGFVKEWIQLVKRREPSAKILVVATHGGPQQRQPDIDRQELWDIFGKDTIVDFFFVDSRPDAHGHRKGIAELKEAIARVAAILPEVGRSVPKSFANVRAALQATGAPYLPFDQVLAICRAHNMDDEIAHLFITISHRLGHLTHYENDPALRDIVILRPDWLATAISYVLDDGETRRMHGLVDFSRLGQLWDDPTRPADTRYPPALHRIFLRLMERFDLSYRVAGLAKDEDSNPVSLIAQLVPDTTPKEDDFTKAWAPELAQGDVQQTQICRIVDAANGQSANAEGLFYQLIVRLHKYSLGRVHYNDSVHWQRGLILEADYNGRALLRHIGNDVHITVRAPFPERLLGMLTEEVKYLVESFWEGLRCDVTVPCLTTPDCKGLFEVSKLIENKKRDRREQPCSICNEWQDIDRLLRNAPAAQADVTELLFSEFEEVKAELAKTRQQLMYIGETTMKRFDRLDSRTRRTLSRVDKTYTDFIHLLTDEAKEGPRLFSLVPVNISSLNPRNWTRDTFRLTLWCEHSRLPLTSPELNGDNSKEGVYVFDVERGWLRDYAPYFKIVLSTLSLVLPVASSGIKLINSEFYKDLEEQLDFGKKVIDAFTGEGAQIREFLGEAEKTSPMYSELIKAQGAILRKFHAFLKSKDPGFGGLVRVLNKRNEFLWVHEKFAGEY